MKKHISLLLVLAMLICVLAGCGSGTEELKAPKSKAAEATLLPLCVASAI